MPFPGVWMTESENMIYRVVPKCACSTVGQAMFYADHGRYYNGDIHDATCGIHKWALEGSHDKIESRVTGGETYTFGTVRNPYTRVLSSFFDKICGIQRNGQRYRGNLVPMLTRQYGVEVEGDFDQIQSFRRFLLFVRDTIRFRKPMDPDIHWSACSGHISTLIRNGGRYDYIFATESFNDGMKHVLANVDTKFDVDINNMPRFNESADHSPKRAHPVEDYFDDLSNHLIQEIYRRDFNLFKYAKEPHTGPPTKEMDLAEIHAKLRR